jgi:hypothetical protein
MIRDAVVERQKRVPTARLLPHNKVTALFAHEKVDKKVPPKRPKASAIKSRRPYLLFLFWNC